MIYLSNEPYPQEISVPRSFGVIVPQRNTYLSTADIAADLTTDSDTKVLAASQGVALKAMVDAKADASDVYNKQEVDAELALKADADDVYTKQEVDGALAEKADASDIPTKTSDLTNDSGFVTGQEVSQTYETKSDATAKETALQNAINRKQDILTFDNVPTNGSSNPVKSDGIYDALATKQPNISDLQTIRSGAAAGATAVQPAELQTELSQKQDRLISGQNIKTINNTSLLGSGNIVIQGGGSDPEAVKFTPQTLTDAQKEQARTNIGAGTYSKPSDGIPATDLAEGVIPSVPVQDVEVDGVSVLNDGVAEIPAIPTTYAGSATAGGAADKALGIPYGSVDSDSTATNIKASVDNFPSTLVAGVCAYIRNDVVSSASGFTLNINGTGAKPHCPSMQATQMPQGSPPYSPHPPPTSLSTIPPVSAVDAGTFTTDTMPMTILSDTCCGQTEQSLLPHPSSTDTGCCLPRMTTRASSLQTPPQAPMQRLRGRSIRRR